MPTLPLRTAVEHRDWQVLPHVPWAQWGDRVPRIQPLQYLGGHRQHGHHCQTLECGDWGRAVHPLCEWRRVQGEVEESARGGGGKYEGGGEGMRGEEEGVEEGTRGGGERKMVEGRCRMV